MTRYILIRVT